jgi:hypothetical protein
LTIVEQAPPGNAGAVLPNQETVMPIITGADAPRFTLPGLTFIGLAAPSRGARENAVWRLIMEPGVLPVPHHMT